MRPSWLHLLILTRNFNWISETWSERKTIDTLDAQRLSTVTDILTGDFARKVDTYKETVAAQGRSVRGRQVLFMLHEFLGIFVHMMPPMPSMGIPPQPPNPSCTVYGLWRTGLNQNLYICSFFSGRTQQLKIDKTRVACELFAFAWWRSAERVAPPGFRDLIGVTTRG